MVQKGVECCVIGDAMIDLIFPLIQINDFDYIISYGGVVSTKSMIFPGGTANVAVNFARLGGKSAFIGKVGEDYFGKAFKEDLKINKVIGEVSTDKILNTGLALIIILPNKQRFFIVDRGANVNLVKSDINFELCSNSKYLYITGYSFQEEKPKLTVKTVINELAGKVRIVFNPGSPNLVKMYKKDFIRLIENYVDILILNSEELQELVKNGNSLESLISHVEMIALTKSEKGSIIKTKNETHHIKAYSINAIDTTGAGDAYAAGLIFGLSREWNIYKAGRFASKIASMVVSEIGPRLRKSFRKVDLAYGETKQK